jgi:hypothetical protein
VRRFRPRVMWDSYTPAKSQAWRFQGDDRARKTDLPKDDSQSWRLQTAAIAKNLHAMGSR